ncbi:MAG: hypothetical protein ACI4CA_07710 [Bacteroides sp.]
MIQNNPLLNGLYQAALLIKLLRGAKVTTKTETAVKSCVNNGEKYVNSQGKEKYKKRLHNPKQSLYQGMSQQTKKVILKFQFNYKPIFSHHL